MIGASIHPAALAPDRLLSECDQQFLRRSGPGGQNRNKVETAVLLTHRPTGLASEANERRTQGENRAAALFRLRLLLALQVRTDPILIVAPGVLWKSRCKGGRINVNTEHEDFPALLAEALDFLHRHEGDVPETSLALGISPSQLTKLLKQEPRAFAALNHRRRERGPHPLK